MLLNFSVCALNCSVSALNCSVCAQKCSPSTLNGSVCSLNCSVCALNCSVCALNCSVCVLNCSVWALNSSVCALNCSVSFKESKKEKPCSCNKHEFSSSVSLSYPVFFPDPDQSFFLSPGPDRRIGQKFGSDPEKSGSVKKTS